MAKPKEDREYITSLARGLSVIHAFDRDHPELTVSQAAQRTGLNPGVVRRCLLTLQRLGYVGFSDRRFFLLPKIVALGSSYLGSARIEEVIQPILRDVVAQAGDSASLGVLDGGDVLYLANFSAKRLVRLTAGVGARFPAYAVSMGRVLLAGLPPEQLDRYFSVARLQSITRHTETDAAKLRAIVAEVAEKGHVVVRDELEEGLGAVAVPVVLDGETVAALNSSAYRGGDGSPDEIARRVGLLQEAARRVGEAIARFPALAHSIAYRDRGGE